MTNPLLEVLIIAAISIFVLSRLYVALGKDDGPPAGPLARENAPADAAEL